MLDQKWKSTEAVYRSKSRRNSTSNSQRFVEAMSRRIKSCWSTIAWTISKGTFFQQCMVEWSEFFVQIREWMARNFSIGTSEQRTNFTGSHQERTRCNAFPYYHCLRQILPESWQDNRHWTVQRCDEINSSNRVCDQVHQQAQEPNTWKP